MDWKQLLAYITGSVDQELLLRNEYLVTENRILRHQITGRVRLTDTKRRTLATIGKKLGKHALKEVASLVTPDAILAWHRRLVAQKFDGSGQQKPVGRRKADQKREALVVRLAQENRSWGYDRIAGALAHLGYPISDQTVGNILKRHGIRPVPQCQTTTTWHEFIRVHMDVLVAGLTGDRTALVTARPCRAPHYTISDAGLIDGGHVPRPGEVWLAHHGVLFLDEWPEFRRHVIAVLRQTIEDRVLYRPARRHRCLRRPRPNRGTGRASS
jgi:hypothetical protein